MSLSLLSHPPFLIESTILSASKGYEIHGCISNTFVLPLSWFSFSCHLVELDGYGLFKFDQLELEDAKKTLASSIG